MAANDLGRYPPSPESRPYDEWSGHLYEPLAFPEMPPPKSYTHYHGRWIRSASGDEGIEWVTYPSPIRDQEHLAENVPTIEDFPEHWINRILPDGTWTTEAHKDVPLPYIPRTQANKKRGTTSGAPHASPTSQSTLTGSSAGSN